HRLDVGGIHQAAEQVAQLGVRIEGQRVLAFRPVQHDGADLAVIGHLPQEGAGRIAGIGAPVMLHGVFGGRAAHGLSWGNQPGMTSPPSTAMACPLIEADAGRASQATASATSAGCTSRPCGLRAASSARAASAVRPVFCTMLSTAPRTMSVSVKPGHTAFTVTPLRATSSASARVRPTTPCLAAQYAVT